MKLELSVRYLNRIGELRVIIAAYKESGRYELELERAQDELDMLLGMQGLQYDSGAEAHDYKRKFTKAISLLTPLQMEEFDAWHAEQEFDREDEVVIDVRSVSVRS